MPLAKIQDDVEIDYFYEKRDSNTPPVIFLNGSIFNYRQWLSTYLPAFRDLTQDDYPYVLYDYQGIGKSSPKIEQFTLKALADELLGLLDFLKIKKAHLFGVSKGSMVGQVFTGLFPDRIVSLAGYGIVNLLGPKLEEEKNLFTERLEDLMTLDDILSEKINSTNHKRIVRTIYTPAIFQKKYSELNLKEKLISWILERRTFSLLEGTPIRTLELLFRYYAQDIEKEIDFYASCINSIGNKPVLLLNGTFDRVTPIELARDLAPRLTNAKLVEFAGFEHISPNIKKKQGKAIMLEYSNFLSELT
ncbi:MAG: alpha/beta hydrolase [Candidatus Heimdallarchaeota archaeon]|nr:MAG: alpha/beta hydrolase [Candidatus Heimdallarchaeota archaeon]